LIMMSQSTIVLSTLRHQINVYSLDFCLKNNVLRQPGIFYLPIYKLVIKEYIYFKLHHFLKATLYRLIQKGAGDPFFCTICTWG
jgi:hypothetical protein